MHQEISQLEISILISLLKWLAGIFAACIPLIILGLVRIFKTMNRIEALIGLHELKHQNQEKATELLRKDFSDLSKLIYNRN